MNIIEGIQQECERLREGLKEYERLGPLGAFGAGMIRLDIQRGEKAIAGGDVVEMVSALAYLREQQPS